MQLLIINHQLIFYLFYYFFARDALNRWQWDNSFYISKDTFETLQLLYYILFFFWRQKQRQSLSVLPVCSEKIEISPCLEDF